MPVSTTPLSIDIATWAIVMATIAGPILAVQAQKAVESIKAHKSRKAWIFETLMATRGQRVALDHVKALNMIDLAFYGVRFFGVRQSKTEKTVIETWNDYRKHLNNSGKEPSFNWDNWIASGNELFYNLLHAISMDMGYKTVPREHLKAGGYSPVGHERALVDQELIRQNAVRVLTGQQPLKFEVTSLPFDKDIAKAHADIQGKLLTALESGALSVEIKQTEAKTS